MYKKFAVIGVVIFLLGLSVILFANEANAPAPVNQAENPESSIPAATVPDGLDKDQHSLTAPESKWVIINKINALPAGYEPEDLRSVGGNERLRAEAASALETLLAAASARGTALYVISGYRSYTTQVATYDGYVRADGQTQADTYSARPGHSEHQTGWVVDVGNGTCDLQTCFGDTLAGRWLADHAHEYGFTIRYMRGKEAVTGYQYEPWHLRYVGVALATELHKNAQTMEEFFGVVPENQPY